MARLVKQEKNKARPKRPGRWKKGESGNPNGRPKGSVSLVGMLKKLLEENPGEGEAVVKQWIEDAKGGRFPQLKEMIERIDGKVADKIESDNKVQVTVRYDKDG